MLGERRGVLEGDVRLGSVMSNDSEMTGREGEGGGCSEPAAVTAPQATDVLLCVLCSLLGEDTPHCGHAAANQASAVTSSLSRRFAVRGKKRPQRENRGDQGAVVWKAEG